MSETRDDLLAAAIEMWKTSDGVNKAYFDGKISGIMAVREEIEKA